MDDTVDLTDVLTAIAASLQGIRSELRAMRLEQRAGMGIKLTDSDTADLQLALTDADEIAEAFAPCEEMEMGHVRVLS
ncbi:hypothetical protein DEIPH_ctg011orf0028 [Deinococcus phoenicis]|uniref:Uncharacterized protein n=1 Tax=Deinococcus phoenicis TaxID=1476583 RepID=A0A016QT83_9DEIO|nr:hypothetical protein [Deinococcus phoenicis]EYB69062.1 hypothetical protein DEIPH_ctg011orf0028 [Deinococcus phoenicis]